jgi:hypothetical protein
VHGIAQDVSPRECFHFICYCADCRAFVRFLERPDVLDAAGGTGIVQLAPSRVRLADGYDALRCVQFSARVLRWYAECCLAPLANTAATPNFPIVALIRPFVAHEPTLGPPICRLFESSATAPLPPDAAPPPTMRAFVRRGWTMLRWRARGLHRPHPFFDERGTPRANPNRLPRQP